MRFQPSKKSGVARSIFDDFGIAGAELPQRQCVERIGIGKNERRLMEGADQILAMRELIPVLPPTDESTSAKSVVGT